jgi:hypothetical protein
MTVDQVIALVFRYLRLIGSLALLTAIILTLAKLFGLVLFPIPAIGFQEFGVLAAGTAYALKNL